MFLGKGVDGGYKSREGMRLCAGTDGFYKEQVAAAEVGIVVVAH